MYKTRTKHTLLGVGGYNRHNQGSIYFPLTSAIGQSQPLTTIFFNESTLSNEQSASGASAPSPSPATLLLITQVEPGRSGQVPWPSVFRQIPHPDLATVGGTRILTVWPSETTSIFSRKNQRLNLELSRVKIFKMFSPEAQRKARLG